MDPLVEVHQSKWPELRDLCRNNWPDGVIPFCLLDTLITYPDFIQSVSFKVFAPDGDISNGFVATCDQAEVMIHPLKSIDVIEKALIGTKKIAWVKEISCVSSASPVVEESLGKVHNRLGITLKTSGNKAWIHFLDKNSKPFEISNPPDTYVDKLRPELLHIVDETWTFHNKTSYKFFEALTRNHLTYVLYSTKNNAPLAWITISYEGSLTHLYCLKEYRRKGYGEYILKYAANDQLNKGKNVLGYTVEKNVVAQKLFDKLNFSRLGYNTWIYITKAKRNLTI